MSCSPRPIEDGKFRRSSRSKPSNRSTTSRRWPSGRRSGACGSPSIYMYPRRCSTSPSGCAPTAIFRSPRFIPTTGSAMKCGFCRSTKHRSKDAQRLAPVHKTPKAAKEEGIEAWQARRAETCGEVTPKSRTVAQTQIALPFLQFSRDKRGYETTSLVHAVRRQGRSRQRILYWFRTPPGVKVGRPALDEEAIRWIEEHNPDIEFNWPQILEAKPSSAPAPEDPRNRRRRDKPERRQPPRPSRPAAPCAAPRAWRPPKPNRRSTLEPPTAMWRTR